ncbi:MAG: Lrp/AsnC family transcriptional regulator [Rhodobacteraceae bacterium]|nr:Lrp/AsnC family transcriptional regulator [Paracoccaceae bacterium]
MAAQPGRAVRGITNIDSRKLKQRPLRQSDISSPDDTLNRSIISRLQQDGRTPFAEIAVELGVSEGTIRNRVNGMKQAGMLRIVAIADPVAVEYRTDAMMGLKVAPGYAPQQVATRLAAVPDVVYILWVGGRYDLLVEVVSNDKDGFLDFLETEIHGQPDIASVETMTGLKNYKNQFLLKSDWGENNG